MSPWIKRNIWQILAMLAALANAVVLAAEGPSATERNDAFALYLTAAIGALGAGVGLRFRLCGIGLLLLASGVFLGHGITQVLPLGFDGMPPVVRMLAATAWSAGFHIGWLALASIPSTETTCRTGAKET